MSGPIDDQLQESVIPAYQTKPTKDPDEYFPFVDLDGRESVFDVACAEGPWFGRQDREGEALYKADGDRYVLLFVYPDDEESPGFIDRELARDEAALWLHLNAYMLPSDLTPVAMRGPGEEPPRLLKGWRYSGLESSEPAGVQGEPLQGRTKTTGRSPTSIKKAGINAGSKAIAAAYELKKEGHAVTVAAAERARVDRSYMYKRYPEAIRLIKSMATPDRAISRGWRDGDRNLEAIDEDD